ENFRGEIGPVGLVAETGRGRIRRVARAGHIVFADEGEIDVEPAHVKLLTVSTSAWMFSSRAAGGTPWPRLKMCPLRPRISVSIARASAATRSGVVVSWNGSRLPCT